MSNRLLIFKVPFAKVKRRRTLALGGKRQRGEGEGEEGAIKAACERQGWLEVPVDNTINLLPRIVKLR